MGKSVKFFARRKREQGPRRRELGVEWKRRLVDLIRLESGLWGDWSRYLDGGNRRFGGADGLGAEGKERVESGRDTGSRASCWLPRREARVAARRWRPRRRKARVAPSGWMG